jgi:plastocyanin
VSRSLLGACGALWTRVLLSAVMALSPSIAAGAGVKGTVKFVTAAGQPIKVRREQAAVIWLEPTGRSAPVQSPKPLIVSQRKLTFVPHVAAVQVGTAVDFPNEDPIFHNVFSNYEGQVFDLQLYAPQTARRVLFRRTGIVHVFCNIHDSMSAVIAVVPTPYFVVADANGRFEIEAPAGEYRLRLWHEAARSDALARMERAVTVGGDGVTLPDTELVVSTDPQPPHKDKYGRDYAQHEDRIFYQGARR